MAKPVVDRLERELEGEVEVVRLSVYAPLGRQVAARYGARGVPSFLLFDGTGQMVQYQAGRLDRDKVKQQVETLGR